jgi:hypothetical protein
VLKIIISIHPYTSGVGVGVVFCAQPCATLCMRDMAQVEETMIITT